MNVSADLPHLDPLSNHAYRFLNERLKPGDSLVVGLSGGLDSVVLTHALMRLAPILHVELGAIHVHHGLSANADRWQAFCQALCLEWGIAFTAVRVDLDPSQIGIEAAARNARYRAYIDVCNTLPPGKRWLALAHHRGDLAETVLFNLIRGSGIEGLAAIPKERPLTATIQLIRPLLDQSRSDLEAYAAKWRLEWVDDESNQDTAYSRNFLRHTILPQLQAYFPGVEKTLARNSALCAQTGQLLDELAVIDRQEVSDCHRRIKIDALARLSPERAANLIRHELRQNRQRAPSAQTLAEIVRQLCTSKSDTKLNINVGNLRIRAWRGLLFLTAAETTLPAAVRWHNEACLPWGEGQVHWQTSQSAGIAAHAMQGEVWLKTRADSDPASSQLRLAPNRPKRPLKQILQESDIPPWQRPSLPLLWIDGRLAWAAHIGYDAAFACPAREPGYVLSYEQAPSE